MMRPLEPVTPKQRVAYGFAFFVFFVALWSWATFGGYVSKTFLANPLTMLEEGFELLTKHGFLYDIGMTIWRVVGGFVLAAILAVRSTGKPVRANLSLDQGIVSAIDAAAHRRGITRSAMVEMLARQHLYEMT